MFLRLTRVDSLLRREHSYLERGDDCFYVREYQAGVGYEKSHTNSLIVNLKKDPARFRGRPDVWRYKTEAINQVASELHYCLSPFIDDFQGWCFVPMPPSKAREHPGYDDRLVQVLRQLSRLAGQDFDVREVLVQPGSHDAAVGLSDGHRPGPQQIYERLRVVAEHTASVPAGVILVDDVLTTGAHFKGAEQRIRETFPGVAVIGVFVARRVPQA